MELRLEVRTEGGTEPEPGSLGWLLANAGHVGIWRDKGGDPLATLYDKAGESITLLAGRNLHQDQPNGDPAGPWGRTRPYANTMYDGNGRLTADRRLSPEAWAVVEKIQREALTALKAFAAECDGVSPDDVDVVLVRVRDRDAGALAAAALTDPAALPILKDRLQEVLP